MPRALPGLTLAALASTAAASSEPVASPASDTVDFHGDLLVFGVRHDNPAYDDALSARFVETTLRAGFTARPSSRYTLDVRGVIGVLRGDSEDLIFVENETEVLADLWNLTVHDLFGAPLELTVGRQEIELGDGFVMWDGAFDRATAWTAEIRSLTGAKLTYLRGPYTATLFGARTNRDYFVLDSTLHPHEGKSSVYGAHLSRGDRATGLWEVGAYLRDDDSALDNDTRAISLRGVYPVPRLAGLELSGEVVREFGHTRDSSLGPLATTQDRRAWASHADVTYRFGEDSAPHVTLSRMHFSGDDPDTADFEGYDPMFFGWTDWGRWYVGSISSWELFNTNNRVWMAEFGLPLSPTLHTRLQLFDFELDQARMPGAGRDWSREANLILDWYPAPDRLLGVAVNHARPRRAAKALLGDASRTEVVLYAMLHF